MLIEGIPRQAKPEPARPVPHPAPARRDRRSRAVAAVLVGAAAVAIAGVAGSRPPQDTSGGALPAAVRTAAVRSGTLEQTLRLTGTTRAENYATLATPVNRGRGDFGRTGPSATFSRGGGASPGGFAGGSMGSGLTLQWAAEAGSRVRKGDMVAEFDSEEARERLDDYVASVEQSLSAYRKMQADIEVDRAAYTQKITSAQGAYDKALLDLTTIPVRSAIDAEKLKIAAEEARATLDQYRQEVEQQEIRIQADLTSADLELRKTMLEQERAQALVEQMKVRAPVDGMVVMETVFRGSEFARVKAGDQLGPNQSFMRIVDPSSMVVQASVSQADLQRLKLGQAAWVSFDSHPGLRLPARIRSIGAMGRSSVFRPDQVASLPVEFELEAMDPRVIPDLTVSVDVVVAREQAASIVPREAIFEDHDAADPAPFLYVLTQGGWERRPVEVGLVANTAAAVRAGAAAGEVVALESPPGPGS